MIVADIIFKNAHTFYTNKQKIARFPTGAEDRSNKFPDLRIVSVLVFLFQYRDYKCPNVCTKNATTFCKSSKGLYFDILYKVLDIFV